MQRQFYGRLMSLVSLTLGLAFSFGSVHEAAAAITMKVDPVARQFWLEGSDTGTPYSELDTPPDLYFYRAEWKIYDIHFPNPGANGAFAGNGGNVGFIGSMFNDYPESFGIQIVFQDFSTTPITTITGSGVKFDISALEDGIPPGFGDYLIGLATSHATTTSMPLGDGFSPITFEIATSSNTVPEPSSVLMWCLAGGGLGWWRLRRRSRLAKSSATAA